MFILQTLYSYLIDHGILQLLSYYFGWSHCEQPCCARRPLTWIWLPSVTTTYSCGINSGTPSCEMMYWIWRETNEERLRHAFPIGIIKQEVAVLTNRCGHLIVSGHQLLDSLSVHGGYVLDVRAFLLGNAKGNVTVSEKRRETHQSDSCFSWASGI